MEYRENATGQLEPLVEYTSDPHEKELMERPIGRFGKMWQRWVENQHNRIVKDRYIRRRQRWAIIPRIIDEEADKRFEDLDKIYRMRHPEPSGEDTMESIRYHKERIMYIENRICEEIVYHLR